MTEIDFLQRYQFLLEHGDISAALNICDEFILAKPRAAIGFWKKATLFARQNQFQEAVATIDEAIRLHPDDARYHFFRGWGNFEIGNYRAAETDQTIAIQLEKETNSTVLIESAYFFRALARIRLDEFEDALTDADEVSEDFLIYLESEGKLTNKNIKEYARNRMKS